MLSTNPASRSDVTQRLRNSDDRAFLRSLICGQREDGLCQEAWFVSIINRYLPKFALLAVETTDEFPNTVTPLDVLSLEFHQPSDDILVQDPHHARCIALHSIIRDSII